VNTAQAQHLAIAAYLHPEPRDRLRRMARRYQQQTNSPRKRKTFEILIRHGEPEVLAVSAYWAAVHAKEKRGMLCVIPKP